MKNRRQTLLTIALLFGAATLCISQNPVQDAKTWSDIIGRLGEQFPEGITESNIRQIDSLLALLVKYYPESGETRNDVLEAYAENPFLSLDVPERLSGPASDDAMAFRSIDAANDKSGDGAATGISVTALADGIARFLVKRTKQELSNAYLEEFRDAMTKQTLLQNLFPATSSVLDGLPQNVFNFNAYLQSLRETFIIDLRNLPFNTENYFTQEGQVLIKNEQLRIYLPDLLHVAGMLTENEPPQAVMAYLAEEASFQFEPGVKQQIKGFFKTLQLFSETLKAPDNAEWVAVKDFREVWRNRLARNFYLAVAWQKGRNIALSPTLTLGEAFTESTAPKVYKSLDAILLAGSRLKSIRQQLDEDLSTGRDSALYGSWFNFLQTSVDILDVTHALAESLMPADSAALKEMQLATRVVGDVGKITLDVKRKNYSSALVHTGALVGQVFGQEALAEQLFRYGAFIAALAECRTSEQVANVIEVFALPPGSAAIKKKNPFTVGVNAYVGLNPSLEFLDDMEDTSLRFNFGINAPVGMALNWKTDKAGSKTLYFSVIDVGALTAYRFGDDETDNLPDLKWSNIIAPGIHYIYGFPGKPLSFGIGIQRGPNLRKINSETLPEVSKIGGWRVGVFFAVDIPVFSFYQ
jgi:hypothetical protein